MTTNTTIREALQTAIATIEEAGVSQNCNYDGELEQINAALALTQHDEDGAAGFKIPSGYMLIPEEVPPDVRLVLKRICLQLDEEKPLLFRDIWNALLESIKQFEVPNLTHPPKENHD